MTEASVTFPGKLPLKGSKTCVVGYFMLFFVDTSRWTGKIIPSQDGFRQTFVILIMCLG